MTELNKYLNGLELRLVFDDGKPGRVYVLNVDKTSIYFIIDVDYSCLYINQDILNIYPEKEIKAFLDEIGLEMDIFPYFNEEIELNPSTYRYFELLIENVTSIKIDFSEYSNHIFLFKGDINIIGYNLKNGYLGSRYDDIWSKIQSENEYNYIDTQRIIKETVERHFKNRVITPVITQPSRLFEVERHFKNRVITPAIIEYWWESEVERRFKNRVIAPLRLF